MANDRLHGKKTLKVASFLDEFEKDDIRKKIDIVDLFSHFGVILTKKGKSYSGKCPWHDDTNPSLSVDKVQGLYNCFGCGESGDVFTLTEKMKGYNFKESINFLKEFTSTSLGISAGSSRYTPSGHSMTALTENTDTKELGSSRTSCAPLHSDILSSTASRTGQKPEEKPKDKDTVRDAEYSDNTVESSLSISAVADFCHKKLYENEKALEYLKRRGFENIQNYDRFKIGFADGSLQNVTGEKQKAELTDIGIFNQYGKEHFLNCLTFPIFDELGTVVGMYGRSIDPEAKIPHLYLKGKHKGIFNRKASKVYDEIILTECIIDALSLIELGFENVQSLYGTNGFTDEHLQIIKDDRVKTVILALDNDEAGKTAAEKIKERLLSEGFKVKTVSLAQLPDDGRQFGSTSEDSDLLNGNRAQLKDWNEYLVSGGTLESVKEAIAKAEETTPIENLAGLQVTEEQGGYIFTISGVSYRVSGIKEFFVNNLRVNIRAEIEGDKYFDNLDLYSARSRANYSVNLSKAFNIEPKRIEKDLIAILEYLETERDRKLRGGEEAKEEMTQEEIELGLSLLKDEKLFERIVEDMDTLGYVGEDVNKELMYVAASTRKLDDPVSVIIVSQSAAGKSMLVDTVKKLIPPEDVIAVTSLSDQALNYIGDLRHKFLILGEAVHGDIIEHQLREMLSAHELSRLVTVKDDKLGKMVTRMVKTEAIVSSAMTTTDYAINPENASRCFLITTDETKEQTERIHERQRAEHTLSRYNQKSTEIPLIVKKHHCAQRLLKKLVLVNPLSKHIKFPASLMRTRRDHMRFLDLLIGVAFLRQYQKEIKTDGLTEYIEVDLEDYKTAYRIIKAVLSSTFFELPQGVIGFYDELRKLSGVEAKKRSVDITEVSITQREIRDFTGQNHTFVKRALRMLVDYEYVITDRPSRSRSKGYYRIRADEAVENFNFSMIPTPEDMEKLVKSEIIL